MQTITIDKGLRDANIEIENGEYEIVFDDNYLVFEIQNSTDDDIIVSIYKGKTINDNGIRVIKKNESGALNHLVPNVNTVYISGTGMGKVYIAAGNTEKNSFNKSVKGGDSSGTGEENTIESIKVNGSKLPIALDKSVDIVVPTKNSELQNDSDYATKNYVGEQIAAIDKLTRVIVEELPADEEAQDNIIYMIMVADVLGDDKYQEYMKIDGTLQMIGDTSIDLTDYVKNTDFNAEIETLVTELENKANKSELTALETSVNNELETKVDKDNIPVATSEKVGGIKSGGDISVSADGTVKVTNIPDTVNISGEQVKKEDTVSFVGQTMKDLQEGIKNWWTSAFGSLSIFRFSGGNLDWIQKNWTNTDAIIPDGFVWTVISIADYAPGTSYATFLISTVGQPTSLIARLYDDTWQSIQSIVTKDDIANADNVGLVKPDNITVSVDADGVLSAQKAIDSIEIGWTNLLLDSKGPMAIDAGSDHAYFEKIKINNFISSDKYALSADVIVNQGDISNIQVAFHNSQTNEYIYPESCRTIPIINNKIHVLIQDINKEVDELCIYAGLGGLTTGNIITVKNAKLERGNKATDWSPAPEDITDEQKSNAKLITQIAHPNNYLIYDNLDKPSTMVAIPKFYLDEVIDGAEHIVHPAFMVNGVEQNAIYISKYQNIVENDRFYSLPMKDPAVNINFDQSWNYCKNKGTGWHLMTNAEWAAIALWCKKNGTIPKGNNNYGKDITETALPQKAISASVGSNGKINRVLTGSGRESWYHDGTFAGIADLNGNVSEWLGDVRLVYGELQIIPYNNAASGEYDTSASSADWKAINANATSWDDLFIIPNGNGTTENSVKLDYVSGHWQWQSSAIIIKGSNAGPFTTTTSTGISAIAKLYLQSMALLPEDGASANSYDSNRFYANNGGDEMNCLRGGQYASNTCGVFYLNFDNARAYKHIGSGGRSAYINTTAQPLAVTLELSDSFQTIDDVQKA